LDKIYKFDNKTYELGGEAAVAVMNSTVIQNPVKRLRNKDGKLIVQRSVAIAAHTTCYEQKSKVMGLKVIYRITSSKCSDIF
jgi:hypothetical protein